MADWKAIGIQIISTIAASSVLLFGLSTFYSDFYNKPNIRIEMTPSILDEKIAMIKVINDGRQPATNLKIIVNSPENITTYRVLSTANSTIVNLSNFNPKFLELYIPKFASGIGSLVRIFISVNTLTDTNYLDYMNVYATYDQGSVKGLIPKQLGLADIWNNFFNEWSFLISIISSASAPVVLAWVYTKRRRRYLIRYTIAINTTYGTAYQNRKAALERFDEIGRDIGELFAKGELSESHYKILSNQVSEYVGKLLTNSTSYEKEVATSNNIKSEINVTNTEKQGVHNSHKSLK